jgi:hypothetical protein
MSFYAKESEVKRAFLVDQPMIFLVYKESYLNLDETNQSLHSLTISLLQKFKDVFPEEMPSGLPPIRGIECQTDFVPGAVISNRPAYRSNPEETKELQWQFEDLLSKGYMRDSMSSCALPVLLVPKKDGTWRTCVDCKLLVCNWAHSVGQNHFFVMMLFNRDSAIQSASRRFCTIYKSKNSVPCQSSRRRIIPSGRPTVQSIIRPDNENFPSGPSSVSISFELPQLASVWTFQQHVWTTLSVRQASGFLSKTQLWEVRCNHPDALIHKASIPFKIQTSGHQSSWSECASIRYGNCVHQINRPNDHPLCPDARSLGMEITCNGSATVQMTGHHFPDAAQIRKEFQRNFWKVDHTVIRPDAL